MIYNHSDSLFLRAADKVLINLSKQIKRKALYNIISIILIIIGLNH